VSLLAAIDPRRAETRIVAYPVLIEPTGDWPVDRLLELVAIAAALQRRPASVSSFLAMSWTSIIAASSAAKVFLSCGR